MTLEEIIWGMFNVPPWLVNITGMYVIYYCPNAFNPLEAFLVHCSSLWEYSGMKMLVTNGKKTQLFQQLRDIMEKKKTCFWL